MAILYVNLQDVQIVNKKKPRNGAFLFNWLRSVDLLRHLETFAGANRRLVVRLVSAVEPHLFCGPNPTTYIKKYPVKGYFLFNWLRSVDLNHRPSGYEKTTFLNF